MSANHSSDTGTIVHLPECTNDLRWMLNPGEWVNEETDEAECVLCCMLRACEERVRDEERGGAPVAAIELAGYSRGYAAALDAARKAVAALPKMNLSRGVIATEVRNPLYVVNRDQALTAIDALREEKK